MKKNLIFLFISLFLISGCTSLQTDVYVYSENNSSIYDSIERYEDSFIQIDNDFFLKRQISEAQINAYINQIEKYLSTENIIEPALKARLYAYEGLFYQIAGNNKKSDLIYVKAKQLQSGDSYVLILGERLKNNLLIQEKNITDLLNNDSKNGVLLLEKGKLQYAEENYNSAVACFDEAFKIFESQQNTKYIRFYKELRNSAWNLYNINKNKQKSNSNITSNPDTILTFEKLILLTKENTTLLSPYSGFVELNTEKKLKTFIDKLDNADLFTSPSVSNNSIKWNIKSIQKQEITNREAARFLWNAWSKANNQSKTKFSDIYKNKINPKSPVADIPVDDPDFDAVLGLLEIEVMDLKDGRNFFPEKKIYQSEFLQMISRIK